MALYLPKLIPDSVPGLPTNIQLPAAIQEPQVVLNAPKIIPYTLPYNPNWRYVPWQRSTNYMYDYNDPNQINSIPDIISASLKSDSPFKTLLSETFQFIKRGTIDPLRAGEFGQAGINALINFTETADILANPTKALLMGHGFEGAANALGFGGNGRVNYDWDTGSLFKDIVLEIVSDPGVWVSLGIKALGTAGTKGILQPAIKAAAGEAADEFDDKVYKNLAKGMVESFYKKDTEQFIQKAEAVAQRLSVMKPGVDVPPQEFAKALVKATQAAKESVSYKISKSLYTAGQISDKVERNIFRAALMPSIYPTWWLAKKGFGAVEDRVHNRVMNTYKRYLRPDGAMSVTDFDELVFVAEENEAVFGTLQKLLKLGDVDVPKYVLLQLDTGIRKDVETISELFGKYNDNYEKLTSELTRYMQKANKVDSLESYVGVLQKVNSRVDGYFDYAIKNYEVIIDHLADLKKFIESSNVAAAYKNLPEITRKNYNEIVELFRPAAKEEASEELSLMFKLRDKLNDRPDFNARYVQQMQKALTTTEWNINVAVRTTNPGFRGSKVLDTAVAYYPAELRNRLLAMVSQLPLEARNMMEVPIVEAVESYTREVYKTFDNFLKSYRTDPQAVFRYPLVSKYILDVIDKMDRLYSAFADEIAATKLISDNTDSSNIFAKMLKDMDDETAYNTYEAVMNSTLTALGRVTKKVERAGVEQGEFIKGFKQLDELFNKFDVDDFLNIESRNFSEGSRAYITQLFEDVSRLRFILDEADEPSLFLQEAPEIFNEVSHFLKAKKAQLKKQVKGGDFISGTETTLPKLLADITKFLEETDHINPLALEDVMMTLAKNPTVAQLRMEAISASLDLTTRGEVGAFFKRLRDKTDPLTQMINFWAERAKLPPTNNITETALIQASTDLLYAAYKASAYSQLLNNVGAIASEVTDLQKLSFISTLQNYAAHAPDDFLKTDYWINKIFSDTNVTLRTLYANEKYGLDMMLESIEDWGKDLTPRFKKYLSEHRHTAPGDVALQYAWMKEVRPDIFAKYPNLTLFDIETTGTREVYGEVLEIAFIGADGNPKHFIRKIPESRLHKSAGEMYLDISQDLLETLFRDLEPEDRMTAFRKKYVVPDGEKVISQQELLAAFSNALPEKDVTLMAHNGLEFDFPYLDWKLKEYGSDLKMMNYKNAIRTDSLQELLHLDGDLVLSPKAQEKFRDYFSVYATQMKELGSQKILDNGAKNLKQGLSEFRALLRDNKFDQSGEAETALSLIMQKDIFSELDHLHKVVAETLDSVNRHGKVFGYEYLTDPFRKITPETRQAVTPELRAKYGPNAESVLLAAKITDLTPDEVYRIFGSNLNLPRLLKGSRALPPTFYRNVVDAKFVQRMFDVPDYIEMSRYILTRLTRFSKAISKAYSKIKTPYVILKHAEEIQKIFDQIKTAWIHPFNANLTDPIEQFLIIKYLLLEVPDQGTGIIRNVYKGLALQAPLDMSPALRNLIDDPERIYHYTLYGQALSKDEALATFSMTSLSFDADYLDALVEENIRQVHNLEMIGAGIDNKLIQANVYAGASIQKPILDIQKRLQKMTPIERVLTITKYKDATNVMGDRQVKDFLKKVLSDPDYLISTLVWENPWITFSAKQLGNATEVQDLIKTLMKDSALWEERGVHFMLRDNRFYIYMDRVKNRVDSDIIKDALKHITEVRSLNGISIKKPEHTPLALPDFLSEIDKTDFQKVIDSLNNLSAGKFTGSSGNLITKSRVQKYYAKLPEEIAQVIGPVENLLDDKFWKGIKFDWVNIGTPASRKYLEEMSYKTILDSYKNSMRMGATITESRNLYLSMYFNSQMDINAGALKEISDQALLDSLKRNDEFVLTALVEDASPASHGYRVVKLRTETLEDIAQARRLGAIIVPYQTFATAFQALNADVFSNQFLNFWHKVIYAYKVGFLLDPGVFFRNALDSTLKNVISADGNVALVAKKQVAAMQLLHRYNRSLTAILNSNKNKFNYENVKLYFEKLNKDPNFTQAQFEYIHGFIIYSASAGLTGPWKKYLKNMNVSLKEQENIWTTFVIAADWLMTPNKYIEQVNRLAMYMMLEENGLTKTQIFKRIAETHFDYNIKTDTEKLMELIFPFYTFTMRNLEYWINAAMERPWMGSLFEDIMEPIWNFDGLPQEELAYNRSLQHQVMMGNIPINEAVPAFGGTTLKINPSYMDVYNLLLDVPHTMVALTNPTMMESGDVFSELQSKMAPPFQLLRAQGALASGLFDTGASTYAEGDSAWQTVMRNLPLVGAAMTRYQAGPKYAERTGHEWQKAPLTQGTFGATQRWQPKVVKPKKRKTVGGSDSSVTVAKKYVSSYRPNHRAYYPKRAYNYWKDYNSFYRKHYTKKGVSKFKLRSMPYNSRNIHYRIKDLYWYFR